MSAGTGPVDCTNRYHDYPDDQILSTCHVCLSTGAALGLSFHALTGLISLVSLQVLLGMVARNYLRKRAHCPNRSWRLFQSNADILMFNLIVADIMMSFGSITDIRWVHLRQVYCGGYCNAQGVIQTLGETAAALSTLSVAVYTFLVIRRDSPVGYNPRTCIAAILVIWLWALLWSVVPLRLKGTGLDEMGNVQDFYNPTPWWCWINGKYMTERIIAEYLWLWIAGAGSVLYIPACFTVYRQSRAVRRARQGEQPEVDEMSITGTASRNTEVAKLLLYPAVYALCVLPMSIMRWAGFVNPDLMRSPRMVPASMVFGSLFNLMGFLNVMLTLYIRPAILLISYKGETEPINHRPRVGSTNLPTFRVPSSTSGSMRFWAEEVHSTPVIENKLPYDRTSTRSNNADVTLHT